MHHNIYILTTPTGGGKTTALLNAFGSLPNVSGFLTPDIAGQRMFLDLANHKLLPFQVDAGEVTVGRFSFSEAVFLHARVLLSDEAHWDKDWMIIDEAGKLEIEQHRGFEPALSQFIEAAKNQNLKLLLVIRDSLLDQAIKKYQLQNFHFIHMEDLVAPRPIGLIVCGGKSSRMKTAKAFLSYHGMPQWQHAKELLLNFCEEVYLSVAPYQKPLFPSHENFIEDNSLYAGHGPATGLLSAMHHIHLKPLLVLGCDYPLITHDDIRSLIANNDLKKDAIAYVNDAGLYEPLITLYNSSAMLSMPTLLPSSNYSLQKMLSRLNAGLLVPSNPSNLQSFDYPEQMANFKTNN